MNVEKILVIPKLSKYEVDMNRLGFDDKSLFAFYKKEGIDPERIYQSYLTQKEGLIKLKEILKGATFIHREQLNKELVSKFDLIISYGGDNHLQFISHYIEDKLLIGINSDPKRSVGFLTSVNAFDFADKINLILNDKFSIEEWTRLEIEIDGKILPWKTLSEIYFGEKNRNMMSRHILNYRNEKIYQKSSGILISTGMGSTGWFASASRYLKKDISFDRCEKKAKFLLTEPHNGNEGEDYYYGEIKEGEELVLTSLNDHEGIISFDSERVFNIREGSNIKIKISSPLKVVKI